MQKEIGLLAHSQDTKLNKESTLFDAQKLILQNKSAAIIVEKDKPIGIITRRDLLVLLDMGVCFERPVMEYAKTDVICANHTRSVEYALHLMINHDIRRLVIVDDDGAYVGIVTQDDLMFELNERAHYAELRAVHLLGSQCDMLYFGLQDMAKEALAVMVDKRASSAVVIDENNKPVGIVTESTLLALPATSLHTLRIFEIMSSPIESIAMSTPLWQIVDEMRSIRFRHLVVLDNDGFAMGVIDAKSILRNIEGSFGQFLQKKLKTTRDALNTLPQVVMEVVLVNGEYRIQWANERAKKMFGAGLVDKRLAEIISEECWTALCESISCDVVVKPIMTAIGERYFEICTLVSDKERFQISLNDITHIVEIQKELEQKKESVALDLKRFEVAKKATGVGIWDLNLDTNELIWDDFLYEMYGIPDERRSNNYEMWRNAVLKEDLKEAEAKLNKSIAEGTRLHMEFRINKNGEIRYIEAQAEVLLEGGVARRVIGANVDITERKLTELALERSEKALQDERNIFISGPVVVFKWSGEEGWPVEYVSANVGQILKADVDSLINQSITFLELIHPKDIKRVASEVEAHIAAHDKSFSQEYRLLRADGEYGWFSDYTVMEYADDGSIAHINGYIIDINDKKNAEKELVYIKDSLNRGQSVAHLGSWDLNLKTNRLWWSDEMYRIFGLEPQEFAATYEAFLELVHPEDVDKVKAAVNDSITNKTHYEIAHRIVLKNGEEKTVREKGETIFDEDGRAVRMIGVVHDITEQALAQEQLRLRERQLSAIVENLPVGIFFVTAEEGVVFSNKAAKEIWGQIKKVNKEEFVEYKAFFYGTDKRLSSEEWGAYKSLVYGETVLNDKLNIESFDGKQKVIYNSSIPIFDDKGRVTGAIVIVEDITERDLYEKGLREAKEIAERANRAKSEFLANMSHEIRTPMNAVLGFAELLKGEELNAKSKSFVDGIIISGRNLLGLINDILDLSKIESGKMTIVPEPTDLQKIFRELHIIFEMKAKEKGLRYEFCIEDGFPKALLLDETRVRQILFNLLGNAVKFTEKGGVKLLASFKESPINKENVDIVIKVEDTGIGIPNDQMEMIFEAFRQMDGQSTRKYGGTGLGLTISKKLADIMGAKLEVHSEVGKGSTFTLTLKNIECAMTGSEADDTTTNTIHLSGGKILLVEDIETNRAVVRGFLATHGVKLLEAENGKIGVEMAIEHKPDVILMDMQMPVMDGYEAIKLLKNNSETANIPIVALTASAMREKKDEIRRLCDGYLHKPINSKTLVAELAKYLLHTTTTQNDAKRGEDIVFDDAEREKIATLLEKAWVKASKLKSNDEIEEFAKLAKKRALEINSKALAEYADALIEACESFKIKEINKLFDKFETMIRKH